ncbi:MAG: hypothetical protein HQL86_01905 [Magnetococcales bacterium]|nr:hypothetical protein [Magnetococcales bacterium]
MEMNDLPELLFRDHPESWDEPDTLIVGEPVVEMLDSTVSSASSHDDLAVVMEDLAGWLSRQIAVEVIAYWNPRLGKSHLLSLAPSEENGALPELIRGVIDGPLPRIRHWRRRSWSFHLWIGPPLDGWDRLLIVEKGGALDADGCNVLIQDAARHFGAALHSAPMPAA